MSNNVTNTFALATVGMLNQIKNKISCYLAIAVMIFSSTFGAINAANAADVTLANGGTSRFAQINEAADALIAAADAETHTIAIDGATVTAASLTHAAGAVNLVITVSDAGTANSLVISGDIAATSGDLTFTLSDDATTLSLGGNFTETGEAGLISLNATDIVDFTGTSKNIDAKVEGVAGDEGKIILSGTTVFDDSIGASNSVKEMSVGASKTGTFGGAADIGVVTNLGEITFSGAAGVDTLTNSGTVNLNALITNVAAGDETALVMHTTGSILNLNDTGDENQDVIITATTDGFGTINIFDGTDDGAASTSTLLGGSLIGASGKSIGTLNVGKSDGTKGGNLTTVDTAAIFADAINITGGNHASEDSKLAAHENLTGTVTLSATGAADATLQVLTAAVTVTGDIDSASGTDGAGFTIIDVDFATTTTGNVGSSVAIEKADIAAVVFNLDGATNVIEATNFSADGELEFGDTTAQTLTGAITSTTNEHGTVENGNTGGLVTISGTVGAEDKRVKEIALLDNTDTTFQSAVFALTLDMDNAAAEDVTTFTIGNVVGDDGTTAGALTSAGGTIVLDTAAVKGTTIFDTKETIDGDGGVEFLATVIQPPANFTNGTLTFVDGAATDGIDATDVSGLSVTDTPLTDFTVNATAGVADVTITATAKSATATGTELDLTVNDATAVHQFMEAVIAGESALVTTLNESLTGVNSGVTSTTTNLAKQASPQTDLITGSTVAAQAVTGSVQGIMSSRMASLRSGDAYFGTGIAAGGMSAQSGFIQVFGSTADQKSKKSWLRNTSRFRFRLTRSCNWI
jgi:hypothetical protein